MTYRTPDSSPLLAISVTIAVTAVAVMLALNWFAVPWAMELATPANEDQSSGTSLRLLADFVLCFSVALAVMSLVIRRRTPHGPRIAAFVAAAGWLVYFVEVGYISGMSNSEYPGWYELLSFVKYPAAFVLARHLHRRSQNKSHGARQI